MRFFLCLIKTFWLGARGSFFVCRLTNAADSEISRGRVIAGCYIGKAEFKGEDMKMYPFFGTSATPSVQAAVE